MRKARRNARQFLPRRTVRSRMTLLYGVLFLLSGVLLLGIAGGFASSHTVVSPAHAGQAWSGPVGVRPRPASATPSVTHALVLGSLIALAVMAAASALLGWVMAGHALRPLRTITATARRISEDNLHERLAFTGPNDELKQLADTFDDLLQRLESAFAAQRRFVANASHELRTPLATMRASLDVALAKPEPIPPQTAQLAGRLQTELDRIDDLLEGFLALARAQHAALPDSTTLPLGALVTSALAARAGEVAARELGVRCEADAGCLIAGSHGLIARMVDNVIDNAIVHNQQRGWLTVTVRSSAEAVRLTVENGGAILNGEQVAQLAQPFRRLRADRTSSDGGSGLGLSIVAAIASAHQGRLELQARPAGGLRVIITLPLAVSHVRLGRWSSQPEQGGRAAPPGLGSGRSQLGKRGWLSEGDGLTGPGRAAAGTELTRAPG